MNSNYYMSIRTKIGSTTGQNVTSYNANDIISKYKNGKKISTDIVVYNIKAKKLIGNSAASIFMSER